MKNKLSSPWWVTDKYILLMLGIFPIWTGFEGYSNITLSKFLFFVAATVLWGAWLIFSVIKSKTPPKTSKCGWCVIALMVVACLSALFSPYRADTLIGAGRYDGLVSLLLYGFIFLGVSQYAAPKIKYAAALAFSVSVCCIVSLLQLMGHNPLGLFPNGLSYFDHGIKYSAEFLGNIGNVDVFAALLCVAVPVFFAVYVRWRDKRAALFLAPAALSLFIALESDVASAKVGLAVSLVVSLIVFFDKTRLKKLGVAVLIAALTVCAASAVNFTAPDAQADSAKAETMSTAQEIKEMLSGHFEDSYGSGRIGIWRQVLNTVPERPLLGGGPGTVADRVSINYSRYVQQTGKTLKTTVDNAHNEYLGYLADEGVLGFAAYAAMIIFTVIRLFRRRGDDLAVIGCGIVGYWAQSFFGLGLCLVLPVIWLCWGLMWSKEEKHEKRIV